MPIDGAPADVLILKIPRKLAEGIAYKLSQQAELEGNITLTLPGRNNGRKKAFD